MRKSWIFKLSMGMFAAVVLSQCGGGEEQKASAPAAETAKTATPELKVTRDNPCSIMFPTEVGEIIGAESTLREVMDEITCRFHFKPASDSQPKSEDGETFVEVKMHWTDGRSVIAARSGGEKLDGVGDEAWWDPEASYLVFAKGEAGAEIDMRMMPDKEKAVRIAQLIAGRL
jgi:hypothetical protein